MSFAPLFVSLVWIGEACRAVWQCFSLRDTNSCNPQHPNQHLLLETWALANLYIYTHIRMYLCMYIYVFIYLYMYIYIKMLNYIACSRDPNICTCRQTQDKLLESGNPNAGVRGKAMQWSAWLCRTCGVQPMLDAQHEWWVTCCYVCSHIKAELSSDVERFSHNRWYISMTQWCM